MKKERIHQGIKLREWLKKKGYSVERVVQEFGRGSKQSIYNLFKEETISPYYIKLFHYILGMDLTEVLPEAEIKNYLSTFVTNDHSSFAYHPIEDQNDENSFDDYHNSIIAQTEKYLKICTSDVFVLAYYPTQGSLIEPSKLPKVFGKKHAVFFELMEKNFAIKKSQNENFLYSRCEQIPYPSRGNLSIKKLSKLAIKYMSEASFEHVCRCMHEMGDSFRFFVTNQVFRPYTYLLADKKMILAEYHYYNRNGIIIPDVHITGKIYYDEESPINHFITAHIKHLNHLNKHTTKYQIKFMDLWLAINELQNEVQNKLTVLKTKQESSIYKNILNFISNSSTDNFTSNEVESFIRNKYIETSQQEKDNIKIEEANAQLIEDRFSFLKEILNQIL